MSDLHQPPRYRHWTQILLDVGTLYAIFWSLSVAFLCWMLPLIRSLVPSLWGLALPFLLPVFPSLALALSLWFLSRRHGYPTVWAAFAKWIRQGIQYALGNIAPAASPPALTLGTIADGRPFGFDSPALDLHLLVDGKTRQGKSTLLASIAWQDVARADCAVLLLDPHAALVDHLLAAGLPDLASDRLVVLLADQDAVPGFNLLQPLPGESPQDCAARLVESALALWFDARLVEAQRFQNYAFHAAWALAETGWTVLEVEPLLRHRTFRQHIAAQVSDPQLRSWLAELDRERDDRIRDLTESTVNRFRAFGRGTTALILGQRRTTFDLPRLLDTNGVLLAALPTAALGDTGAYLAAGVLLGLVDACLARRPKDSPVHTNPRLRLLADEAQAYPVPPLRRLLAERAGFGAGLVLATQSLGQLPGYGRGGTPPLARFILNNVGAHAVFACGAEEAHTMAEELFRPDPLLVKHRREPWVTFYSPREQMAFWAKQIQNLPPHTFFAHVPGRPPVRCTTLPLPARLDADGLVAVRAELARRVGRPRAEVEAELARRRRWIYEGGSLTPEEESPDGWL